ncbi:MAG: SGNH/GDSL hydrolase family protein [Pseudomonadota bacterium]
MAATPRARFREDRADEEAPPPDLRMGREPGAVARRAGPVWARLALLLASCVVALGLAEAAMRLSGRAPTILPIALGRYRLAEDPRLGWEPVPGNPPPPNGTREFNPNYDNYPGQGNALGYRDREHARAKPADTQRVVVIGDSIAEGWGVARFEDTFPSLLEQGFRRSGTAAEVINLGVSGYGPAQEVATLELRGLAYDPDVVVMAWCSNDVLGPPAIIRQSLAQQVRRRGRPGALQPWLGWSALYRYLWVRHLRDGAAAWDERGFLDGLDISWDLYTRALDDLAALSREHGFSAVVVTFPRDDPGDWDDMGPLLDRVTAVVEARSISSLDLRPAFRACLGEASEPLLHDNLHPSPTGHRCAADALRRFLVERGFIR